MRKLEIARSGYTVMSGMFYLSAGVYLLYPEVPPLAACWFGGISLVAYGIIKIIGYFSEDLFCLAFRYDLAFGTLLLAVGTLLLIRRATAFAYLPAGIGWLALLDSVLKIQMSEEAKKFGLERWNTISALAVATGVLGTVLIIKSAARSDTVRILPALVLTLVGAMNHCVIQFAVKQAGDDPGRRPRLNKKQRRRAR